MLSISHGTPLRASAGYVLPGSRQPYAAAVKKPKGAIFPVFCTFPAVKGLHPARLSGQPLLPRRKSGKNMEERLILLFVCGTVHLPGSAPSRFQLTVSATPLHHGRKNRSSRKRKGMLPYSPG